MLRPLRLLLVLAVVLAPAWVAGVPAGAATLPRLEADSLGGHHVVLPTDAAGKPLIVLLAFTKESEGDLKSWSRSLLNDHVAQNAVVYVVVVADRTAFVSRSHIRSIVEGAAVGTKEQIADNVLVTFDGTGWFTLVPPADKSTAGVVVCDANGTIVYAKRVPYSAAALAEVEKAAQ